VLFFVWLLLYPTLLGFMQVSQFVIQGRIVQIVTQYAVAILVPEI